MVLAPGGRHPVRGILMERRLHLLAQRGITTEIQRYYETIRNSFSLSNAQILRMLEDGTMSNPHSETKMDRTFNSAGMFVENAFHRGTKRIVDRNGNFIKIRPITNFAAVRSLQRNQFGYLKNLGWFQRLKIAETLQRGAEEGWSTNKIAKQVETKANHVARTRAIRIARSEMIHSHSRGLLTTMAENEIDRYQWKANYNPGKGKSRRPCHICRALHNEIFDTDAPLWTGRFQGKTQSQVQGEINRMHDAYSVIPAKNTHPNCFSDDTEVLTNQGWKLFKDLDGDMVYTFNEETEELELQKPKSISYDFKGELYHLQNKSLDILCTGNHKILMANNAHVGRKKTFFKNEIENIMKQTGAKSIPAHTKGIRVGKSPQEISIAGYEFKTENWAKFLGIFLAEGSTSKNGINNVVSLAAVKDRERNFIITLLNDMNLKYSDTPTQIRLYNKKLTDYLKPLSVGAVNKDIPEYVYKWDKELIETFIDAYHEGDGNKAYWGVRRIWTTSIKIANGLQRLFIMIGLDASLHTQKRTKAIIMGKECNAHDLYCVQERLSKHRGFNPKSITKKEYDGKVYCVEVPNGNIIIRRNNKPTIISNCRCTLVADI